mmetsp:Transcript_20546/g.52680  ORF Transcript_20546/g.52680 Transcript_20546/m.52680 type:complete len:281 (+) Transcript_20546:2121-2963(+)
MVGRNAAHLGRQVAPACAPGEAGAPLLAGRRLHSDNHRQVGPSARRDLAGEVGGVEGGEGDAGHGANGDAPQSTAAAQLLPRDGDHKRPGHRAHSRGDGLNHRAGSARLRQVLVHGQRHLLGLSRRRQQLRRLVQLCGLHGAAAATGRVAGAAKAGVAARHVVVRQVPAVRHEEQEQEGQAEGDQQQHGVGGHASPLGPLRLRALVVAPHCPPTPPPGGAAHPATACSHALAAAPLTPSPLPAEPSWPAPWPEAPSALPGGHPGRSASASAQHRTAQRCS